MITPIIIYLFHFNLANICTHSHGMTISIYIVRYEEPATLPLLWKPDHGYRQPDHLVPDLNDNCDCLLVCTVKYSYLLPYLVTLKNDQDAYCR